MKFKLDESFGTRTQQLFRDAGHGVLTVRDQELQGTADGNLYEVCRVEQACLVTLDLDFSDVLRFPPTNIAGIVVLRVPQNPSLALLERLVSQFLNALKQMSVENQLWIVEAGRIRIYPSGTNE